MQVRDPQMKSVVEEVLKLLEANSPRQNPAPHCKTPPYQGCKGPYRLIRF